MDKLYSSSTAVKRGHVNLLHAILRVKKDLENTFHHCGGAVKLVHACLSMRRDLDSSFRHCGGPVKIVDVL